MIIEGFRYIEVDPNKYSGKPVIKNTRVTVEALLESLGYGWNVEEVSREYNVPVEAVREAVRFALDLLRKVVFMGLEDVSSSPA
ncbi:DUF433 domain-containing protein [Desulfurococcaceae archaeon MEX13E-LK6-19]|nr:DUF433 domain-containing protein [Desulfurococcaceae archaeon MEX13E-LK6-19]